MLLFLSPFIIFLSLNSNIFAIHYNLRSSDELSPSPLINQKITSDCIINNHYTANDSSNINYNGMSDLIIQIGTASLRKENTLSSAELHNTPPSFEAESPRDVLECNEKNIDLSSIDDERKDAIVILTYREQPCSETQKDLAGQPYFNIESLNNPDIKRISVEQKLKSFNKKSKKRKSLIANITPQISSSNENFSNIKPNGNSNILTVYSDPAEQPQESASLTDNPNNQTFPFFEIFTNFDEQPLESIESTYNFNLSPSSTLPDLIDFNEQLQESTNSIPTSPIIGAISDFEEPLPEATNPSDSRDCYLSTAIENSSESGKRSKKRKSFDSLTFSNNESVSKFHKKSKKSEYLTDNLSASISSSSKSSSDIESVYYSDSSMDFSDCDKSSSPKSNSSDYYDRQISPSIENSPIRSIHHSEISIRSDSDAEG